MNATKILTAPKGEKEFHIISNFGEHKAMFQSCVSSFSKPLSVLFADDIRNRTAVKHVKRAKAENPNIKLKAQLAQPVATDNTDTYVPSDSVDMNTTNGFRIKPVKRIRPSPPPRVAAVNAPASSKRLKVATKPKL